MNDGSNDPALVAEWQAELDRLNDWVRQLRNTVRNAQPSGTWKGLSLDYWLETLRQAKIERNIWIALRRD